jgi:ABC-type transport system involved in Fe-S cluster assembly fused permease/ATPase subunit
MMLDNLRSNISFVPQDSVLFNDTAAYNIAYGSIGLLN